MKLVKGFFNSLLIFITIYFVCFPFGVYAANDISQGALKGDLRLGTYKSANKNKVEIEKTDANGVSVKKVVTKKSTGTYNVEFFVKGPTQQVTSEVTLPVYVVFVIDRSYSMRNDNRWTNAEKGAQDISKEFAKLGVNMAAIGYSGGRTRSESNGGDQTKWNDTVLLRNFSKSAFGDLGGYDEDYTHGGGTNMYAGLMAARDLLKDKTGVKHIILLTDGVPTFYYNSDGYTKGPGNSNTNEKISAVPAVIDKTIAMANSIKNQGITIHTIGYHLDKLTFKYGSLNENSLAKETLRGVSSSGTIHLVDSTDKNTNVDIELGNIKEEIMNLEIANDPIIEDGIGNAFKLSTSTKYGGTKKLSKTNYAVGTSYKSIGSFDININTAVNTGWYATNADFTLKYTHITKGTQTLKVTEDPEVFWTQPVSYVIKHVEKGNVSNVLKTENGTGEISSNVTVTEKSFSGYNYDSKDKSKIVLNIDVEKNIAYVYYVKNNYNYTIYHVEKNNTSNVLATESSSAKYKDTIIVNNKSFDGYTYDSKDKDKIVIDTTNNIAYVYYTRNNYDYTIIHQEKGNPANVLETVRDSAKYQDVIKVDKKDFSGYSYDSQDKSQIVIDKTNNIAYVYYVKNNYDYTIYHVEKNNPFNVLDIENDSALYQENIPVNKKSFTGYSYDSQDKNNIVIDTTNNVAYVYYTRNTYDYTIYHVEKENPSNVLDIESGSAKYEDIIMVDGEYFEGYSYHSQDKDSIIIYTTDNIAYVYYTKNIYSYKVEYYKENLASEFEIVTEDTVTVDNSAFGSETSFTINDYVGYTYVPTLTENANVLQPANNDLVIRLYYTLNESEVSVYYVIKVGDEYIPFEEYALDENGNVIADFENVLLNSVHMTGKYGTEFSTEYRVLDGYNFIGLYEGNIMIDNTIPKLDGEIVIGTFDNDNKAYTYVYELPIGTGDEFPPHTGIGDSLFINNNNVAILEDKKRKF